MAGVHALKGRLARLDQAWGSVPCAAAILLEPNAGNTGQNITLSRAVLADAGIAPHMLKSISNEKHVGDRFDSRFLRG